MIFQTNSQVREEVQLYVKAVWVSLSACLTQTIVAHATSRGIQIDIINIDVEGYVDLRGFTGISDDVRPGAQQFRVNMNIKSNTASEEQIAEFVKLERNFRQHLIH